MNETNAIATLTFQQGNHVSGETIMPDEGPPVRTIESAGPKCYRHLTIELDFEPTSARGVVVTCDHCGERSRLSAYQRELARQAKGREKARLQKLRNQERQQDAELLKTREQEQAARKARIQEQLRTQNMQRSVAVNEERRRFHAEQERITRRWRGLSEVVF